MSDSDDYPMLEPEPYAAVPPPAPAEPAPAPSPPETASKPRRWWLWGGLAVGVLVLIWAIVAISRVASQVDEDGPESPAPTQAAATAPVSGPWFTVVYFGQGEAGLTAEAQALLAEVPNHAVGGNSASVLVRDAGPPTDDNGLTMRRGQAVVDALTAMGVDAGRMDIKADGGGEISVYVAP